MPRNSLTNGKQAPDSFNTQLDECAYPLMMALAVGLTGRDYYTAHIRPAANFVATHGPAFGPERWEEQDGFSPSTISAEIAGLIAAAKIADMNGDALGRRLARRRRRVPAQPQALDADHQRPARARARTSSGCPRPATRTRRSPTTSATAARRSTSARSSTPASSSTPGSACCRPTIRTSSRSLRGRGRDDHAAPPSTATASCATTATATATARPTATRGRRPTRATATSGRCWPASAAVGARPRQLGRGARAARRRWPRWPPASG